MWWALGGEGFQLSRANNSSPPPQTGPQEGPSISTDGGARARARARARNRNWNRNWGSMARRLPERSDHKSKLPSPRKLDLWSDLRRRRGVHRRWLRTASPTGFVSKSNLIGWNSPEPVSQSGVLAFQKCHRMLRVEQPRHHQGARGSNGKSAGSSHSALWRAPDHRLQ